jgi:hypothetical protein
MKREDDNQSESRERLKRTLNEAESAGTQIAAYGRELTAAGQYLSGIDISTLSGSTEVSVYRALTGVAILIIDPDFRVTDTYDAAKADSARHAA